MISGVGFEGFRTGAPHNCAVVPAVRPSSNRFVLFVLCAFFAVTVGCGRHQLPPADIQAATSGRQRAIDEMIDSTVKVTIERDGRRLASASGVVVASREAGDAMEAVSYVLTASHALAGGDGARIVVGFCGPHASRGKFSASVVSRGNPDTLDLSLLRVPGIAVPAVRLSEDEEARLGQPILVIGFPEGERLGLSGGIVSQLPLSARPNGIPADRPEHRIMIDAAAPRGVSGGGVFEVETGRLVGIVQGHQTVAVAVKDQTQTYTLKFPVPGETFVVPMAQIRPFLASPDVAAELRALLPATTQAASDLPR